MSLSIKNLNLNTNTSLTLADRRLYNYLLHHAFNQLSKKTDFSINLSELKGVYGVGMPPIENLKESLRRLIRTLIEFNLENGEWVIINLLAKGKIEEKKEQLYYSFPSDCQSLFMHPFILEGCLIQAHFTLKYSNLLYEVLSHELCQDTDVFTVEINELRKRLNILDNKLANFNDFDRFVLQPAINEINSYASFAVKYFTKRKGMRVTHVCFELTKKKNIINIKDAKQMIPPKRPRLFIESPELERAYAYLLNAETKERRHFFEKARKKHRISEEKFDTPDLWFKWIEKELLKKINKN